jgi:hypothetical protein
MKIVRVLCCVSVGAALAAACGGTATVGKDLTTDDAGESGSGSGSGSSSGSGDGADATRMDASMTGLPPINVSCQGAQTCPRPQVCCAMISLGGGGGGGIDVACANSCGLGGFQVCATTAECTTNGDVCTASPLGIGSYCTPARDAATRPMVDSGVGRDGGPIDGGAPADTGSPVDAARADGAVPMDAQAPIDAAAIDAATIDAATDADAPVDASGSVNDGDSADTDASTADGSGP